MFKKYVLFLFAFSFSGDFLLPFNIPPEEPKPLSVVELIEKYSEEYQVPYRLAYELAKFESNLSPTAKNPNSSARGVYQFLTGTWKGFCEGDVLNAEDNISCAMRLISEGGLSHWTSDQYVRLKLWDLGLIKCSNYDRNQCRLIWDYN